jgi:hypothetical protein
MRMNSTIIQSYLREKTNADLFDMDENTAIDNTLNNFKESLKYLAEQYDSKRAQLLAETLDDLND